MKKVLKISGIVILILIAFFIYSGWKNGQKHKKAEEIANHVIDNLDNESIYTDFPEKYFPKDQLLEVLTQFRQNCDWQNRDGKYVDFFNQKSIGGTDQIAFIYEYYLNCDSLRIILAFNIEDEIELMRFNFEPLEKENEMILFPEKQLINR